MKAVFVSAEIRENMGVITLNNPQTLNAITENMLKELAAQIDEYEANSSVKVIVLKGIEKSFAAGLDIKYLAANLNTAKNILQNMQDAFVSISSAKKPLIAAVSGFALGIGCEIIMHCDIVLAADNARFGLPELSIGLLPCFGGCGLLAARVGKAKAMDMILSGRALTAEEAEHAGLVSRIVTEAAMTEEYTKLAKRIAGLPQNTVAAAKKVIKSHTDSAYGDVENLLGLSSVESADFRKTLMNFAQKKPSTPEKA